MAKALQKIHRLSNSIGARLLLAAVVAGTAGCAAIPQERAPTGFNIRGGEAVQGPATAPLTTVSPADTRIGRDLYGTVNPGARVGRKILSQHLIGQLPFGLKYDDGSLYAAAADKLEAARTTEHRERWMDTVTQNNNAFRAGRGQALMVGSDAADVANQYQRLMDFAVNGNGGNREVNTSVLLQSYRDTLAARQDTSLLVQAEPRLEHFQDYAQLEMGRRVLGDILIRSGALVERTVKKDYAPTYGFMQATAIGLVAYEGRNFGPTQVLLADDAGQSGFRVTPQGDAENRYVDGAFSHIRYQADQYNAIRAERARQQLGDNVQIPSYRR